MGRKRKKQRIERKHKQKTLTDIFVQSKKREEKDDRISHHKGVVEKSEDIEKESEIIPKLNIFDFSDSKGYSQESIEELERIIDEIREQDDLTTENIENGES